LKGWGARGPKTAKFEQAKNHGTSAMNHPLLDGNKRAAGVTLRLFIDMNGWLRNPYPSTDEAEQALLSVASGEWNEERVSAQSVSNCFLNLCNFFGSGVNLGKEERLITRVH
jgi:prophage maintenance system killer protein